MAGDKYEALRRFMFAIILLACAITLFASAKSGASAPEIVLRALTVSSVLIGVSWVIVRTWASWDVISRSQVQVKQSQRIRK